MWKALKRVKPIMRQYMQVLSWEYKLNSLRKSLHTEFIVMQSPLIREKAVGNFRQLLYRETKLSYKKNENVLPENSIQKCANNKNPVCADIKNRICLKHF